MLKMAGIEDLELIGKMTFDKDNKEWFGFIQVKGTSIKYAAFSKTRSIRGLKKYVLKEFEVGHL